jgi:hypothetical protein
MDPQHCFQIWRCGSGSGKNGPRLKEEKMEKFHFRKLDHVVWRLEASVGNIKFIYELDPQHW